MSIQLQFSGIFLLFYSLLFCIVLLIKFKCLYAAGVQKSLIYALPSVHMARTNRPSSVQSTRHNFVQQNGQLVTRF